MIILRYARCGKKTTGATLCPSLRSLLERERDEHTLWFTAAAHSGRLLKVLSARFLHRKETPALSPTLINACLKMETLWDSAQSHFSHCWPICVCVHWWFLLVTTVSVPFAYQTWPKFSASYLFSIQISYCHMTFILVSFCFLFLFTGMCIFTYVE